MNAYESPIHELSYAVLFVSILKVFSGCNGCWQHERAVTGIEGIDHERVIWFQARGVQRRFPAGLIDTKGTRMGI